MDDSAGVYVRESAYLDCYVQLGIAQGRVISVDFPTLEPEETSPEHDLIDRVEAYLQGTRDEFDDVSVAMTMPTEQVAILEVVRDVPYGEDATVEQLTRMVPDRDPDEEDDKMAVREALAENPVPIFVPDHRVRDGPSGAPPDVEQTLRTVEGL